jgi:dethiobiotin synthetase
MNKNIFITGIDTGVGKTITSAIFAKALGHSYWKPIQCGNLEESDRINIKKLFPEVEIIPSVWELKASLSPHAASKLEGISLTLNDFRRPLNKTIVEGAGGILVPLNDQDFVIDLASQFQASIVIVSQYYLGSINHTLLTINEIKRRGGSILGLVFNGETNVDSREIILSHHQIPVLLDIKHEGFFSSDHVTFYAEILKKNLYELQ